MIDESGKKPATTKESAIKNMPSPEKSTILNIQFSQIIMFLFRTSFSFFESDIKQFTLKKKAPVKLNSRMSKGIR